MYADYGFPTRIGIFGCEAIGGHEFIVDTTNCNDNVAQDAIAKVVTSFTQGEVEPTFDCQLGGFIKGPPL